MINEEILFNGYPEIANILLYDNTTKKNIIWATSNYENKGAGYSLTDEIKLDLINKEKVIKPRLEKTKEEQSKRSKDKAEVFTPSWICNEMNNLIDKVWFGAENSFNIENGKKWIATEKVIFPNGKTWQDYVINTRLEITCGEAPFLVSRYDTVTGNYIELKDRIGFLDRKIRVVNENCNNEIDWIIWSLQALESIYGYEFQGDNLLIARENVLFDYIDYYQAKFNKIPPNYLLESIATIISWNLWQMDGLKNVVPFSCHDIISQSFEISLFDVEKPKIERCPGCKSGNYKDHNGIRCMIMDWGNNKPIEYISLMEEKDDK